MDIESLRCTIGDFVRFSHDVISVGITSGRVKALTLNGSSQVTAVQLEGPIDVTSGEVYAIRFRKADMSSVMVTLPAAGATTTTDTFTLATPVAQSACGAVGDLYMFGLTTLESIPVIVSKIRPGPDLTAVLTLVPAPDAVWTADAGTIPTLTSSVTSISPSEREVPPDLGFIAVSNSSTAQRVADGTIIERISLSINPIPVTGSPITSIDLQFKHEDSPDWVSLGGLPPFTTHTFITNVQAGETYDIRVRTTMGNRASAWTEGSCLVEGKTYASGPCTSLSATSTAGANSQFQQITLTWVLPEDEDLWHVEVWRSATNDRTAATKIGTAADPAVTYIDTIGGNGLTRYYWVRPVNTSGAFGDWNAATGAGVQGNTRTLAVGDVSDNAVTTPKVIAGAITNFISAVQTSGAVTLAANPTVTTIQTFTIPVSGYGPISIVWTGLHQWNRDAYRNTIVYLYVDYADYDPMLGWGTRYDHQVAIETIYGLSSQTSDQVVIMANIDFTNYMNSGHTDATITVKMKYSVNESLRPTIDNGCGFLIFEGKR
jgi:hypothetical protein